MELRIAISLEISILQRSNGMEMGNLGPRLCALKSELEEITPDDIDIQ
jgi:hypothetical protein